MANRRRSVLLVSDQVLFRQALACLLREDGLHVTEQLSSASLRNKRFDVAVVDLAHVATDTTTLLQTLHAQLGETNVVILGSSTRIAASKDGEADVMVELPRSELSALRAAIAGRAPGTSSDLSRAHRLWQQVTARQREVLRWLGAGLDNPGIAAKLRVGTRAIKAHISALLALFGYDSRTQLALMATDAGLKPR